MKNDVTFFGSSTMPWFYKRGMIAVAFLMTGGALARVEDRSPVRFFTSLGMIPVWIVLYIALCYYIMPYCNTFLNSNGLTPADFITSITGFVMLKQIVTLIPSLPLIEWIGRHSIGFYFMSGSVVNVLAVVAHRFFPDGGYFIVLLIALCSFSLAIPIVWVLNRYFSFLFDLRKIHL